MSQLAGIENDIMDPQSLTIQLILCSKIQISVNELRKCAKTLREKLEYKSFVRIESITGHAEMKMDFKWDGGSPHFSFQVVTTKTNQTRGYFCRNFKVDRSESTSSKKKCIERSLHSQERR